jgi:antitoxin (DNA-binding transcriptional repressor) of toxin-antitoxin stability system
MATSERSSLRYLALRDLRNTPGALWRKLQDGATVAITAEGEPRALVLGLEGTDLPEALRLLDRLRAQLAVGRLRAQAAKAGAATLSAADIDREVRGARRGRRR